MGLDLVEKMENHRARRDTVPSDREPKRYTMANWTYEMVLVTGNMADIDARRQTVASLDRRGADGWELVSLHPIPGQDAPPDRQPWLAVFKKPL